LPTAFGATFAAGGSAAAAAVVAVDIANDCHSLAASAWIAMLVVVGSTNPVKLNAVKGAFARLLPSETITFESVDAPSGVAAQPYGDRETRAGATSRAAAAATMWHDTHGVVPTYTVGLEGGVEGDGEREYCMAWIVIRDARGALGVGRTGGVQLPMAVCRHLSEGVELGVAIDRVFDDEGSKRKGGCVVVLQCARPTVSAQCSVLSMCWWR
jgi:inosine/xanthosine triphosphatase